MKNNGIKKGISLVLSCFVFALCLLQPVATAYAASDGKVLVPEECTDTVTVWEYPDGTREAEIIIPEGVQNLSDNTGEPERLEESSENVFGLENTGNETDTLINDELNRNEAVAVVEKENKSMRFTPVIPDILPIELPEELPADNTEITETDNIAFAPDQTLTPEPASTSEPASTQTPSIEISEALHSPSVIPEISQEPVPEPSQIFPEPAPTIPEEEIPENEPKISHEPDNENEQLAPVLQQPEMLKSIKLPVKVLNIPTILE